MAALCQPSLRNSISSSHALNLPPSCCRGTSLAVSTYRCFTTQRNVLRYLQLKHEGRGMSRLSFFVLIVIGLTLTVYFAVEAWRLSDSDRLEITGGVSHR